MRSLLLVVLLVAMALSGCADMVPPMEERHDHDPGHAGNATHDSGHGSDGHTDAGHGADHEDHEGEDHAGHLGGMSRPGFPPADGSIPTADDAKDMPQVSSLRLIGDKDLESSGYAVGNGTLADPYVISGLYVTGDLMLQDTDACVVIRENYVGGQLTLNWNGQCVHVHHNYLRDLRVNENIRRVGYATGGYLEFNEIGIVGQLRHYDGVFGHNTVGPRPSGGLFDVVLETTPLLAPQFLIANIDGFNQGIVHNNTFHGSVDLDFHGHHHGTGFFASHSHYHGDDSNRSHGHDHTERWTSVQFVDNTIIDEIGYGLRYEDRNHAGDDRVASSEQEEELDEDHFHRTDIVIARNTVHGAGIWIDVFNADDAHHKERNDGWLTIEDNEVHLVERDDGPLGLLGSGWHATTGFQVFLAKEVELVLRSNSATFKEVDGGLLGVLDTDPATVAYRVDRISDAVLIVEQNRAQGYDIGMSAQRFTEVDFTFRGNDFGDARQPTQFDDSVPEP